MGHRNDDGIRTTDARDLRPGELPPNFSPNDFNPDAAWGSPSMVSHAPVQLDEPLQLDFDAPGVQGESARRGRSRRAATLVALLAFLLAAGPALLVYFLRHDALIGPLEREAAAAVRDPSLVRKHEVRPPSVVQKDIDEVRWTVWRDAGLAWLGAAVVFTGVGLFALRRRQAERAAAQGVA